MDEDEIFGQSRTACLRESLLSLLTGAALVYGAYFYVGQVVSGNIEASSRNYYRSGKRPLLGNGATLPAVALHETPNLATLAPQPAQASPPSQPLPPSPPSIAATPGSLVGSTPDVQQITIFCFAWTPRRANDERLLPFVRKQFSECDGYTFFTDTDALGSADGDILQVEVPKTKRSRTDSLWLYHQNMVALAPAWTFIIEHALYDAFDWLINVELDHFFVASRARTCIQRHLEILREGSQEERKSVNGPLILSWGNAFVFNRKFIDVMATKWTLLGKPITEPSNPGMGCPMMTQQRATSTGSCEQDMGYTGLAQMVSSDARKYGPDGCSQFRIVSTGKTFPLACWQDFPIGSDLTGQMDALREIALMKNLSHSQIKQHCETRGPKVAASCEILYRARDVPVMHNFKDARLHDLAQKILLP